MDCDMLNQMLALEKVKNIQDLKRLRRDFLIESCSLFSQKIHLRCLSGSPQVDAKHFINLKRDIFLTASKYNIVFIISLHLEFRSVKCLSIRRKLKQLKLSSRCNGELRLP